MTSRPGGAIYGVCAGFDIGFVAQKDMGNRYYNPSLGGGAANDLTVYALHLLPWLTDRQIEFMNATVIAAPSGVDETEMMLLTLSGGLTATVRSTLASGMDERMELCGTRGRIVVPKPHMAKSAILFDGEGHQIERFDDTQKQNGFTYEVIEAVCSIRGGELESPVIPHSATIQAAHYIQQLHKALQDR